MRRIMAAVMAFFLDTVISANIFVAYSADAEVVGQHFFQFGIREVKGVFSGTERRYTIRGVYNIGEDFNSGGTFDASKRKVLTFFDWEAEGRFNPASKATYEKLVLTNKTEYARAGWFTSTMKCNEDPWLEPYSSGLCQAVVIEPSDKPNPIPPRLFFLDLTSMADPTNPPAAPDIPFSAALTAMERFRLNQQFNAFLASRQKIGPGSLPMDESTAPMIVYPAQNGYMVYKKSEFVIQPNPKFPADQIYVEFTQLATGVKLQPAWVLPTTLFTKGVPIPYQLFGTQTGRYEMRARIDSPKPGAFSRKVQFEYLMQSPKILFPPSNTPPELQKR
jgi:hypothetical protein